MDTSRRMRPEAARWIAVGAGLAGLAVAAGAFGAHGLSGRLAPGAIETFETAAHYHLIHALAVVMTGVVAQTTPHRGWQAAGLLFTFGIFVFGGSLYLLALTGWTWLGAVTPFGGVGFLAGWAVMVRTVWSLRGPAKP